jgi:hypothetical protein
LKKVETMFTTRILATLLTLTTLAACGGDVTPRIGPQTQPVSSGGLPTSATLYTAADGEEIIYPAN